MDDNTVSRAEFDALQKQVETLIGLVRSLEKEIADMPRVRTMTTDELFAKKAEGP